jgi:hypothetical protein
MAGRAYLLCNEAELRETPSSLLWSFSCPIYAYGIRRRHKEFAIPLSNTITISRPHRKGKAGPVSPAGYAFSAV